jgi:D-lyxose ketol-isomerase
MADQEASGENKPQPKQEGQVINLIVKDQQGSEVHFKVKSHTKLEKVSELTAARLSPQQSFKHLPAVHHKIWAHSRLVVLCRL